MQNDQTKAQRPQAGPDRRDWIAPSYTKMKAGDAELGPFPVALDDFFTKS